MTLRGLAIVLTCVAMIASGHVLFKVAAGQWRVTGWTWESVQSLLSPPLILAMLIYGAATFLWVYALRTLSLSVALPIFALQFVIVPLLAHFILGETLTVKTFIGAALIIAGIAISVL
jgi:undecaprenyl phosphate-alpha-L-ara4N flippase subunit ArnE